MHPSVKPMERFGRIKAIPDIPDPFAESTPDFTKQHISSTNNYKPKPYHTPENIGVKWQMDVKHIPRACYAGNDGQKFCQNTMIDEASRKRFIYPFPEYGSYYTVQFVKLAIAHFGYKPKIIRIDNDPTFTNIKPTKKHAFDILRKQLGIIHQLIRPLTPWHNGKSQRSGTLL